MSEIRVIKILTILENMMCVYRNYSLYNSASRVIILIQMFVHTVVFVAMLVNNTMLVLYLIRSEAKINQAFNNTEYFFAMLYVIKFSGGFVSVIFAIQSTKQFKRLVHYLMTVHHCCTTVTYTHSLRLLETVAVTIVAVPVFIRLCLTALKLADINSLTLDRYLLRTVILFFSEAWMDARYILESVVLHTYVTTLCSLLKCLNNSIYEAQTYVKLDHKNCVMRQRFLDEQIQKWIDNYRLLLNCSRLLSSCFALQAAVLVACSCLHAINMLSKISISFDKNISYAMICEVYSVLCSIFAILVVVSASQNLLNASVGTSRALSQLYNTLSSFSDTATTRRVKNFLELVKTEVIKIQLLKSNMGMYIVPAYLMFIVSYYVLFLQLNNAI